MGPRDSASKAEFEVDVRAGLLATWGLFLMRHVGVFSAGSHVSEAIQRRLQWIASAIDDWDAARFVGGGRSAAEKALRAKKKRRAAAASRNSKREQKSLSKSSSRPNSPTLQRSRSTDSRADKKSASERSLSPKKADANATDGAQRGKSPKAKKVQAPRPKRQAPKLA